MREGTRPLVSADHRREAHREHALDRQAGTDAAEDRVRRLSRHQGDRIMHPEFKTAHIAIDAGRAAATSKQTTKQEGQR